MKNFTLMAFILMTVFLLNMGGCASSSEDQSSRGVAEEHSKEAPTKSTKKANCDHLNPHYSDQYFEEYERCQGY